VKVKQKQKQSTTRAKKAYPGQKKNKKNRKQQLTCVAVRQQMAIWKINRRKSANNNYPVQQPVAAISLCKRRRKTINCHTTNTNYCCGWCTEEEKRKRKQQLTCVAVTPPAVPSGVPTPPSVLPPPGPNVLIPCPLPCPAAKDKKNNQPVWQKQKKNNIN